jgi:hypothetical protein
MVFFFKQTKLTHFINNQRFNTARDTSKIRTTKLRNALTVSMYGIYHYFGAALKRNIGPSSRIGLTDSFQNSLASLSATVNFYVLLFEPAAIKEPFASEYTMPSSCDLNVLTDSH